MKPETLIYDKIRDIIPEKSKKTIFFGAISDTSYEMFFYAYIDGIPMQCFRLAEDDKIDENELEAVFGDVVEMIKTSQYYQQGKINIATICLDKSGIKLHMEYADRGARMYGIKKEWKQTYID